MEDRLIGNLEFPCDVQRLPNGNTLITDAGDETGAGSEVLEVNPGGRLAWRFGQGLRFAHSAKRLGDGSTLISDTTNDRILLVASDGAVILDSDRWGGGSGRLSDGSHLRYPNDAHGLEDGSFLVTDRNNNRCLIVDRKGTVLWSHSAHIQHPHNADPLPGGNVLIASSDNNRIIEIDRDGRTVWSYGDGSTGVLNFPRDADRLPNGNTLITDSRNHRVIEVTRGGETVWQFAVDYYASFYEADFLANGDILISDQHHHQVLEVARDGSVVWKFRNRQPWCPTLPRLRNGSFRKRAADGGPEDWHLYSRFAEGGGRLIWDADGAPGLEYDRSGALCIVQYVAVVPGTRYTLSGKIRSQGVAPGKVAYFQLFFLDDYGGPVANTADAPKGRLLSGTSEWTADVVEAEAPQIARSVEIRLFINGPGRVWMKDLLFFS